MSTPLVSCPGCGARLPRQDGPTHAYMTSSPGCWAAFGQVMAREYADPELMLVHRLSVDSWAVQHPGDGSRRAIQSVGLHLARLFVQIDQGLSGDAANRAMLGFAARKASLPALVPPASFTMTVADVIDHSQPDAHRNAVRRWAHATWTDWSHLHDYIRQWVA